jgi:diadenosine tetraphosphate (Ap4A) HIT family hydrolase
MDCLTCQSISGERRISPGPTIHEGQYWYVEHAYPCRLKGWLVLALKCHVEALHELTEAEFLELGALQFRLARLLRDELECQKEYAICPAEAPGFQHVHVHFVPRARDLPAELTGAKILAMLQATEQDAVPPGEIREFCEHLQSRFEQSPHA